MRPSLSGRWVAHYRVLEKLGEGGMGVVYKAEDTRLGRSVALKFLSPELTREEGARKRFIREAQAASALDHPNICVIHQIGETDDGRMYLVMPYYSGETLEEKLARGPLAVEEAIGIAEQIAQGLAAAHGHGIVHRDLKPGNIIVTPEGVVKILDFGLAKLGGTSKITQTGTVMGTVAYMAPEQVRGEEVDPRADMWALGVVLYQMLTGRLPFAGEHPQAVLYSIMNEEPKPLERDGAEFPPALRRVVATALAKRPEDRYAGAEAFMAELGSGREVSYTRTTVPYPNLAKILKPVTVTRLSLAGLLVLGILGSLFLWRTFRHHGITPDAAGEIKRLAVVPFASIRKTAETDYLGFALADQIIHTMTYFPDILVRPSSTVRKYTQRQVDASTVGDELKVDYVLTGNYLVQGGQIRLNVELINVKSDTVLWSESIDVGFENAFQLQDVITERVVTGLKGRLSGEDRQRLRADVPGNPQAYDRYLRALAQPLTAEGHRKAIDLLETARDLDASYAPLYVELGYRKYLLGAYTPGRGDLIHDAETNLRKALSINENLPAAIAYLVILYVERDRADEAYALLQRLLEFNPNYAWGHFALSYIYRYTGMLDEARREAERALALDPGNPRMRSIGLIYVYLDDYEKALKAFNMDAEGAWVATQKAFIQYNLGKKDEALRLLDRVVALEPEGFFGTTAKVMRLILLGNLAEARTILQKIPPSKFDGEIEYSWAALRCMVQDKVACLRSLERTVELGFYNYSVIMKDKAFRIVRNEPEYQRILEKAREKHQAFRRVVYPQESARVTP